MARNPVSPHSGRKALPTLGRAGRTRHRPGTPRRDARAATSAAPARRTVQTERRPRPHNLQNTPMTRPNISHVRRADRLQRVVLGLEPHPASLAVERLHRRLVSRLVVAASATAISPSRASGAARGRSRSRRRGCGSDHRVAAHAQEEVLALRGARQRRCTPRRSARRAAARRPRSRRRAAGGRRRSRAARQRRRPRADSSSSARGLVKVAASSKPDRSRFARWACTVEGEASPTCSPISRTVGG